MTQQINGQLGDWASKYAKAKPIEVSKKTACLELFKQGMGFRKSAKTLGLRPYTVRDWQRRFKAGDESWASRDGQKFARHAEAKDLINYRHEIETFIPGLCATDPASVPSNLSAEEKIRWLEAQNKLLRFHYAALMEHRSGSSPEDLAKKKRSCRRSVPDSRRVHNQGGLSHCRDTEVRLLPCAQALGKGRK